MQSNSYHYVTIDFSKEFDSRNYKPYYLDAFKRVGSDLLILEITPYYLIHNDRYKHEIHIVSDRFEEVPYLFNEHGLPRLTTGYEPIFLYQDSYSKGVLEVNEGGYYQESIVTLYFPFNLIEEKLTEKE
ncbi:hypothetical protein ABIB62_003647 [Mucilaginibacter sp. UYP25]|uniref:hypothetical protein n=1 Tax=unclassified Mucilaginibacter TaxID=2617802 RepID=UPI003396E814